MKPPRCHKCDDSTRMARGRTANGHWQVFWYCFSCNRRPQNTEFIRHRDVTSVELLPIAWDNLPAEGEPDARKARCATCFRVAEVEYHHWAPRHLFGEEAEFWPGAMLCRPCHDRWHLLVTPVMSMPSAISTILAALPAHSPVAGALARSEEERKRAKARVVAQERRDRWMLRQQEARLESGEITQEQFDAYVRFAKLAQARRGKAAS